MRKDDPEPPDFDPLRQLSLDGIPGPKAPPRPKKMDPAEERAYLLAAIMDSKGMTADEAGRVTGIHTDSARVRVTYLYNKKWLKHSGSTRGGQTVFLATQKTLDFYNPNMNEDLP